MQVLSRVLEQIAVGPTDGSVGTVIRNAATTGDAKLLLDANNQAGVAELKVLAGGNCELNAQFQFISFNTTNGIANLAIEPNIGGEQRRGGHLRLRLREPERPGAQGERPVHPGRGATGDLRRGGAAALRPHRGRQGADRLRGPGRAGQRESWARRCARRRTWTGGS